MQSFSTDTSSKITFQRAKVMAWKEEKKGRVSGEKSVKGKETGVLFLLSAVFSLFFPPPTNLFPFRLLPYSG